MEGVQLVCIKTSLLNPQKHEKHGMGPIKSACKIYIVRMQQKTEKDHLIQNTANILWPVTIPSSLTALILTFTH